MLTVPKTAAGSITAECMRGAHMIGESGAGDAEVRLALGRTLFDIARPEAARREAEAGAGV